mgnify:CR=1 FL=1
MKIRYIIILLACTLCISGLAQKRDKSTVIEFRLKKQTYMAQKAGLTEEESQKFFPLYFEFQDKKKEINKQAWSIAKKGNSPETTDQEYEEIQQAHELRQGEIDHLWSEIKIIKKLKV